MLKDKRVLFIAPSFFGYENDIKKELEQLGAEVDYFDERPFNSSVAKILNRLNFKFFLKKEITNHYSNILKVCKQKKYDYLFVISPETMDKNFLTDVKATSAEMISILYMWDSFKNKSNARRLLSSFDRVYSFDQSDRLTSKLLPINFLPLFYTRDFKAEDSLSKENTFTISFIGTVHSDRAPLVKKIIHQYKLLGQPTFCFFYCPSRLLFILKKILTSEYNFISYAEVSFEPMSKEKIRQIFTETGAVIDIQHPDQIGLTMRSIEMFGLNKKLVTTNVFISEYDFYDDSNILIIDRDNPVIPERFINSSYNLPNDSVYEKYSIESWLKEIFKSDECN